MKPVLQKSTALRSAMAVKDAEIEDLRIPARGVGPAALSGDRDGASLLDRQRGRWTLRKGGYIDDTSLVGIFIVGPGAS